MICNRSPESGWSSGSSGHEPSRRGSRRLVDGSTFFVAAHFHVGPRVYILSKSTRPPRPKAWQFAELPDGREIPDLISSQYLDFQWCVASVDAQRAALGYLGFLWGAGFILIIASWGRPGVETVGAQAALFCATVSAASLVATWPWWNPGSIYSVLAVSPDTLGRRRSPWNKSEKKAQQALVDRALDLGGFSVEETREGWNSRIWELSDGTRIKWHGPQSGRGGYTPAEVTVYTPEGGSVRLHRRFKGQMLRAIEEARPKARGGPHAVKTASLAAEGTPTGGAADEEPPVP